MADLTRLYEAVLNGDQKQAISATEEALAADVPAMDLINGCMIPAMDEVGKRYECEDYFVPELLLSARAMKGSLGLLRPLLAAQGSQPVARVAIGTVKGDLHDIGKNLVASMLEGGGFEVIDLGTDVAADRFIEAIRDRGVTIVCLSALLTVTMPSMQSTIDALKEAGVREQVKVFVGGAPVTEQFANQIGADGYGANASIAVSLARRAAGTSVQH